MADMPFRSRDHSCRVRCYRAHVHHVGSTCHRVQRAQRAQRRHLSTRIRQRWSWRLCVRSRKPHIVGRREIPFGRRCARAEVRRANGWRAAATLDTPPRCTLVIERIERNTGCRVAAVDEGGRKTMENRRRVSERHETEVAARHSGSSSLENSAYFGRIGGFYMDNSTRKIFGS